MKKVCTTTLALLLTAPLCYAPNYADKAMYITESTPIKYYSEVEKKKTRIFNAIWAVEHPRTKQQAYLAFKKEGALGPFQIHQEVIDDVNNIILKKKKYTHKDCLDSLKSVEILTLYHGHWTPSFEPYRIAMVHNGGPTWYKAKPHQKVKLQKYWREISKNLTRVAHGRS